MISCFNVFLGCVSYGMHGGWRPSIKNWGVLVNKSPFICLHFLFCFSFQLNSVTVTMDKPTYLTIRSKTRLFFWKFVLSCLVKCRILYADICSWISCFVLFCYNGFFSALVKEEISEISVSGHTVIAKTKIDYRSSWLFVKRIHTWNWNWGFRSNVLSLPL